MRKENDHKYLTTSDLCNSQLMICFLFYRKLERNGRWNGKRVNLDGRFVGADNRHHCPNHSPHHFLRIWNHGQLSRLLGIQPSTSPTILVQQVRRRRRTFSIFRTAFPNNKFDNTIPCTQRLWEDCFSTGSMQLQA